jgi:O-antigen/teichoic acid export membrane protein
MTGGALFMLFFPVVKPFIAQLYQDNAPQLARFLWAIIPLSILIAFSRLVVQYTSNFQRIVVPSVFQDLLIKLTLPSLILLLVWGKINSLQFVYGLIIHYAVVCVGVICYLAWLGQLKFKTPSKHIGKNLLKRISKYGGFSILAFIGGQIAFRIDSLMIGGLIGLKEAGIYTIVSVLSEIIIKPNAAIRAVAGPIIAYRIEKNDLEHVEDIYKRSSLNLFLMGLFIFLMIWLSVNDVFQIMSSSEEMVKGLYVIFFLGLARVIEMATGLNSDIINYSKYYAWSLVFILFLAVTNIVANILLIREFGIEGAAMATLISVTLYNLLKLIFIQVKFKMHPLSLPMLYVSFIALIAFGIVYFIPLNVGPIFNLIIRSAIFALLFILPAYFLKVSRDMNEVIGSGIEKLKITFFSNHKK